MCVARKNQRKGVEDHTTLLQMRFPYLCGEKTEEENQNNNGKRRESIHTPSFLLHPTTAHNNSFLRGGYKNIT
jgi:hypothetical protein